MVFPAIYLHKAKFKVIKDLLAESISGFLDKVWHVLSHRSILEDVMRTNTGDPEVEFGTLHFPNNMS